jgi:hypothetical protein
MLVPSMLSRISICAAMCAIVLLNNANTVVFAAESKPTLSWGDYVERRTGLVTKPTSWSDIHGDSVWRSSWLYASLLVIREKDPALYKELRDKHGLDLKYLQSYLDTCLDKVCGDNGWHVPGSDQKFSRDQLAPMLYMFAAIAVYEHDSAIKTKARKVLLRLNDLEKDGTPLSSSGSGKIGDNLRYVICVLADKDRFDFNYKTAAMEKWLVPAFGDLDKAKANRRAYYKTTFTAGLEAQRLGSLNYPKQISGVFDETTFFNAIALVTAQSIVWGANDHDVKRWRNTFDHAAKAKFGPGFRLASGADVSKKDLALYREATICRRQDNDIVMAQRAKKYIDNEFPSCRVCDGKKPDQVRHIALDFVILQGLNLARK